MLAILPLLIDTARPIDQPALIRILEAWSFPRGYWHACVFDDAINVMQLQLKDLALAEFALPVAEIHTLIRESQAMDEDLLRRKTIALALERLNEQLAQKEHPKRFFNFAEDCHEWETDEPIWILLLPEERALLLQRGVLRASTQQ